MFKLRIFLNRPVSIVLLNFRVQTAMAIFCMLFDMNVHMRKNSTPLPSIVICILMDLIGYASFAIPGLGEFSDLLWAPLSAFIFYKMFGGRIGVFGGMMNFVEELLPFADFIPSFTIAWMIKMFSSSVKQTKAYGQISA